MAFNNLLNPILNPLLNLGSLLTILIISIVISLIITLAYKFFTNQEEMKRLKEEMKESQKKMKEFKNDPQKMMSMQKESMQKNLAYMKHSIKPTLITFLPIIIIFGWLGANLAFEPIQPGQKFSVTITLEEGIGSTATIGVPEQIEVLDQLEKEIKDNEVSWNLKGEEGSYLLEFKVNEDTASKEILIDKRKYKEPTTNINNNQIRKISVNNDKIKPLEFTKIPWVKNWGWLGTYIIFSIVFSVGLRKIMKLH